MDFEKMLKNSRDAMIKACTEDDTNENFIIMIGSVAVEPADGPRGLVNKRPHSVKRFLHKEAVELASKCKNGNGEKGKAVYWRSATEDAITICEESLEFFNRKAD